MEQEKQHNAQHFLDLIQKSGSWYRYEGEQVGQGKEKALLYLQENPTLVAELEEKVRATF